MKQQKITIAQLDLAKPPIESDDGKLLEQPLEKLIEGEVTMNLPGYEKRQELRVDHVMPDVEKTDPEYVKRWIGYRAKVAKLGRDHCTAISLKLVGGPAEAITDVAQLEDYEVYGRVFEALGQIVIRGIPLGKS